MYHRASLYDPTHAISLLLFASVIATEVRYGKLIAQQCRKTCWCLINFINLSPETLCFFKPILLLFPLVMVWCALSPYSYFPSLLCTTRKVRGISQRRINLMCLSLLFFFCWLRSYNLSLRWFVFVSLGNWKGVTYDVFFCVQSLVSFGARANRQLTSLCDNFMGAFFREGVEGEKTLKVVAL